MQLALADLFQARWTDEIHDEWTRNVLANRPDISPASLARCRELMDEHVPDCLVTEYEALIPTLHFPTRTTVTCWRRRFTAGPASSSRST